MSYDDQDSRESFRPEKLPYSFRTLPPAVCDAVADIKALTKAPVELIVAVVLAACSVVVQSLVKIQMKEGFIVPCSLYFMIIADSGERKTAVQRYAFKAHREFEREQEAKRKEVEQTKRIELERWKVERKAVQRLLDRAIRSEESDARLTELRSRLDELERSKPEIPRRYRLIHSDVTPQAFLAYLAEVCRSAALVDDEAGRVLSSRSGVIRDLGLLNKTWDGGDIDFERLEKNLLVKDPRVTIAWMVQSGVLRTYLDKKGEEMRGIGFFARCLTCFPESTRGTRIDEGPVGLTEGLDRFHARIRDLLGDAFSEGVYPACDEKILHFSAEAQERLNSWFNEIERHQASGGKFYSIPDYASKIGENTARLAAIFHVIQGREGLCVGIDDLRSAIAMMEWHAEEFRRLFAELGPEDEQALDVAALYNWMVAYARQKDFVDVSYLMRRGPYRTRPKAVLEEALRRLEEQYEINIRQGRSRYVEFRSRLINRARYDQKTRI